MDRVLRRAVCGRKGAMEHVAPYRRPGGLDRNFAVRRVGLGHKAANEKRSAERRPDERRGFAVEVRTPVQRLLDRVFELVEVRSETRPRLLDFLLYVIRCFAHSTSSLMVSTVFSGTA